ncbi:esterase/lipase family protein [Thermomonas brevis]
MRRLLLVHGLHNTRWWLRPLAARLRREGFEPEPFGYASVFGGPERAIPALGERLRAAPVHGLVGHSLGGLIALEALRRSPEVAVPRVVCLGSPLRGSRSARNVTARMWTRPLLGRSAALLQDGLPDWDGAAALGVIAGDVAQGLGRVFGRLDGVSDGTVALEETRLTGLADHCVVHCSHSGLVFSAEAAAQAACFLRDGRFARPA